MPVQAAWHIVRNIGMIMKQKHPLRLTSSSPPSSRPESGSNMLRVFSSLLTAPVCCGEEGNLSVVVRLGSGLIE